MLDDLEVYLFARYDFRFNVLTEQGRCKSTFCSILLPTELQRFYLDKFDLTSESGCEQKLSLFGLINMDEFDRYSVRSMAMLKNLMQLKKQNFRKSHRAYYSQLPRIASFIGTSNQKELLTDTTGSRRFLCVEVPRKIDCTLPNHAQLYAQLKTELLTGERYWFTSEEEQEIQENNRMYYKHSPEQDVFFRCFRFPEEGEEGVLLSPTEIFCRLQKKFPSAFRGSNASRMGKLLTSMGFEKIRTKYCCHYRVVPFGVGSKTDVGTSYIHYSLKIKKLYSGVRSVRSDRNFPINNRIFPTDN